MRGRAIFGNGQAVHWARGARLAAEGKITERYDRRIQRRTKGAKVGKDGTPDNPPS